MSAGMRGISRNTRAAAPTKVGITSSTRFMMYRYIACAPLAPDYFTPASAAWGRAGARASGKAEPPARYSPRFAEKTVLRRGDAFDRPAGERSLVGRSGGVFQVFEGRYADQRRRNCLV